MDTKVSWLFYHLQGEKGESPAHPNACRLIAATPGRPTLADVTACFPLSGSGIFHYRFQSTLPGEKNSVFLDLVNPADVVPTVNGNVVAKVLRVDATKCASSGPGLTLRGVLAYRSRVVGASSSDSSDPKPATAASNGSARSAGAASSAVRGGGGVATPPPPPVTVEPPVVVPDVVDEDLQDKSDYVKATVMARRAELARIQAERIAEVEAREAAVASEQVERDAAKSAVGATLEAWATEHGRVKPVRILLSTLHTVLWEGTKWEPVPMAKLVVAAKVKFYFMRAITIVHPDKQGAMDATQRFIATQIFHALETAYRTLQETEMQA